MVSLRVDVIYSFSPIEKRAKEKFVTRKWRWSVPYAIHGGNPVDAPTYIYDLQGTDLAYDANLVAVIRLDYC